MSIRESRFGRLTGHFLAGFLDNDLLVSSGAGMSSLLTVVAGILAAPGPFYCLLASLKYGGWNIRTREMMAWEDRLLFVHVAMIVAGLLAVIQWDALFPDRRDYQILTPLPIPARLVFLAKACSVALLVSMFWAAGNLGTAVLYPAISMSSADSTLVLLSAIVAHLAATFAGSAFVFLAVAAVQGVLLNLLPDRWFRRVSMYVQMAVVLVLVIAFFLGAVPVMRARAWITGQNPLLYGIPQFWFLGLYQVLMGRGGTVFGPLAGLAVKALAAATAVCAVTYFASYRRHAARTLESTETRQAGPGWLAGAVAGALHLFLLRHPLERAQFHFVLATLRRSRVHRLLLAACCAVGFALVLGIIAGARPQASPTVGILAVQQVLSFLMLCGMRYAFTLPTELQANWVFQAADPSDKRHPAAGARKAMLALGAAPVLAVLWPLHAFFWGWATAIAHLLYGALISALLVELLLLRFDKLPFTCSYLPGKANMKALWSVYVVVFWSYVWLLSELEASLFVRQWRFALFCAAAVAALAALRRYRSSQFIPGYHFVFDDRPDPAVRTLDIGFGTRQGEPEDIAATQAV